MAKRKNDKEEILEHTYADCQTFTLGELMGVLFTIGSEVGWDVSVAVLNYDVDDEEDQYDYELQIEYKENPAYLTPVLTIS